MQEAALRRVLRGSARWAAHLRMRNVGDAAPALKRDLEMTARTQESLILKCPTGASKDDAGAPT
ncbi:hypothetical protein B5K11_13795 [Rhizobium leguminosarum bv. trifolii]|nr:hypothetical protein B5K11_13795 [Rhizobium leguminosarum bv. trifolii]